MPRPLRRSRRDDGVAAVLAGAASAAAAAAASLPPVPDPTTAAFFDVDNTMIRGASIYFFGKGMRGRGLVTTRDLLAFGWDQAWFRISGKEDLDTVAGVREKALGLVAGKSVSEIVAYGEEIYDELMEERIWSGTRALAQQHLDAGQRVFLVTATPVELARIISARLGLTGALGTVSEVQDGCYTGRLVGEPLHGPAKAEAVRALAEREGIDLARCTAYSDSSNDLPLLSLVGHAVAVNPDARLRTLARERGWEVRDFRTARKAVKIGVPTAAGIGAVGGGVAAGLALRRRRDQGPLRRLRTAVSPGR
ncbi:MAG: HAD-superfamily subfamily hydrolase [Frankiales bacterium]|nr:HAD-superfamily subfamily hydrolase [Frankiales bacterium]